MSLGLLDGMSIFLSIPLTLCVDDTGLTQLFHFGKDICQQMQMISIDFEFIWSEVKSTVPLKNLAVGVHPVYSLCE